MEQVKRKSGKLGNFLGRYPTERRRMGEGAKDEEEGQRKEEEWREGEWRKEELREEERREEGCGE